MKGIKISALVLIILLSVAGYVLTKNEASSPRAQNQCPVSGRKVKSDVFTDYEGSRVYFCCPGCISAFKKAPEKFIKKMKAEGVVLAKATSAGSCNSSKECASKEKKTCSKGCSCDTKKSPAAKTCSKGCSCDSKKSVSPGNQKKCPVMGGTIKKEVFADHQGKRVYFCCPGCIPTFKKNADKIVKKMEGSGIVLAKTPGSVKTCSGGTCSPPMKLWETKSSKNESCCTGGKEKSRSSTKSCSQKTCPMSGMKVNKEVYADYEGKRIYFCGPGCREVFKKDPAKFVKKLEDQGINFEKIEDQVKTQKSKGKSKENRESS